MKGEQTEREGSDEGMRERPREREWMGRGVMAGESSVKSIHALLNQWNSFSVSLLSPFSFTFFHPLADSVPRSSLVWFLSVSRPAFLLSCLSWPYVCDVIQDKDAKLAWNASGDGQREGERG